MSRWKQNKNSVEDIITFLTKPENVVTIKDINNNQQATHSQNDS